MKNTKIKKTDFEDFCYWVADEIFKDLDENGDSELDSEGIIDLFCERACRRLNKLGIVEKKGNFWHYKDANLYL